MNIFMIFLYYIYILIIHYLQQRNIKVLWKQLVDNSRRRYLLFTFNDVYRRGLDVKMKCLNSIPIRQISKLKAWQNFIESIMSRIFLKIYDIATVKLKLSQSSFVVISLNCYVHRFFYELSNIFVSTWLIKLLKINKK